MYPSSALNKRYDYNVYVHITEMQLVRNFSSSYFDFYNNKAKKAMLKASSTHHTIYSR